MNTGLILLIFFSLSKSAYSRVENTNPCPKGTEFVPQIKGSGDLSKALIRFTCQKGEEDPFAEEIDVFRERCLCYKNKTSKKLQVIDNAEISRKRKVGRLLMSGFIGNIQTINEAANVISLSDKNAYPNAIQGVLKTCTLRKLEENIKNCSPVS